MDFYLTKEQNLDHVKRLKEMFSELDCMSIATFFVIDLLNSKGQLPTKNALKEIMNAKDTRIRKSIYDLKNAKIISSVALKKIGFQGQGVAYATRSGGGVATTTPCRDGDTLKWQQGTTTMVDYDKEAVVELTHCPRCRNDDNLRWHRSAESRVLLIKNTSYSFHNNKARFLRQRGDCGVPQCFNNGEGIFKDRNPEAQNAKPEAQIENAKPAPNEIPPASQKIENEIEIEKSPPATQENESTAFQNAAAIKQACREAKSKIPAKQKRLDKKIAPTRKSSIKIPFQPFVREFYAITGKQIPADGTARVKKINSVMSKLITGLLFNGKQPGFEKYAGKKFTLDQAFDTLTQFRLCFEPDYLPENKDWLSKMGAWEYFYNPYRTNYKSMFLNLLENGAKERNPEFISEKPIIFRKLLDSLDSPVLTENQLRKLEQGATDIALWFKEANQGCNNTIEGLTTNSMIDDEKAADMAITATRLAYPNLKIHPGHYTSPILFGDLLPKYVQEYGYVHEKPAISAADLVYDDNGNIICDEYGEPVLAHEMN